MELNLSNIEPTALAEGSPVTRAPGVGCTYWDQAGVLRTVTDGSLRITYDPADLGAAPYALIEPAAATNYLPYSEAFVNWTGNGALMTYAYGVAPDGTTSTTLADSAGGGTRFRTVAGLTAGALYTYSQFVRAGSTPLLKLYIDGIGGGQISATFDTGAAAFSNVSAGATVGFKALPNGLYRVWVTATIPSASAVFHLYPFGGSVEFWGAQLVLGADPGSYIASNAGAAVTRPADVVGPNYGLIYSPLAENDTDDAPLYNPATAYASGARVRRAETHQVYQSAVDNNLGNTPELNASGSAAKWTKLRPTNRWAMFDGSIATASVGGSVLSVVLRPGAVDAIYGVVDADRAQVCVQDAPGGAIIATSTIELEASAPGDYDEYFWEPFKPRPDFLVTGLDPYYDCVVTVTLSKASGAVGCAALALGTQRRLGATQRGVKAKPKGYSYIGEDDYGNTTIVARKKSTDLSATAKLDRADASYVTQVCQRMLDVPAVWIASEEPLDFALRCYGLGSAEIAWDLPTECQLSLNVKGVINAITDTTA